MNWKQTLNRAPNRPFLRTRSSCETYLRYRAHSMTRASMPCSPGQCLAMSDMAMRQKRSFSEGYEGVNRDRGSVSSIDVQETRPDPCLLCRAVRKIVGHLANNHRLAIPLHGIERLNCVVVFRLGLHMPLLDGGQHLDGSSFISHHGMIDEASNQGFCVISVLGGEIGRHRFGEDERELKWGRSCTST